MPGWCGAVWAGCVVVLVFAPAGARTISSLTVGDGVDARVRSQVSYMQVGIGAARCPEQVCVICVTVTLVAYFGPYKALISPFFGEATG